MGGGGRGVKKPKLRDLSVERLMHEFSDAANKTPRSLDYIGK